MMDVSFDKLAKYLCCPNCRLDLTYTGVGNSGFDDGVLLCDNCSSIFPVTDAIPILLKDSIRNPREEIPVFEGIAKQIVDIELKNKIDKEIEKLSARKFSSSWEWDDVDYWDKIYEEQLAKLLSGDKTFDDRRCQARVMQRRQEMLIMDRDKFFPDGLLVEVGAGTAVYINNILEKHKAKPYIAVDMSMPALKIRRKLLSRGNSLFIMGSVDNLPLKYECVAGLFIIGILHHSERKESTLLSLKRYLVDGGIIYLDEAISRPSFLRHEEIIKGVDVSIHEEQIDYAKLMEIITKEGKLEYHVIFNTPIYTFMSTYLRQLMLMNYPVYRVVRAVDRLFMTTLGKKLPAFSAGEVTVLWRKR